MYINELMNDRNMTLEDLCEVSGVPESTLRDILDGISHIPNCKASTLYDIALALDTSVEDILEDYWDEEFEMQARDVVPNDPHDVFYHGQKQMLDILNSAGDKAFVDAMKETGVIREMAMQGCTTMPLYLTALVDYLCRINNIPHLEEVEPGRHFRLEEPVYPARLMAYVDDSEALKRAINDVENRAIPEFLRTNIYETAEHIRGKE